MWSWIKSKCIKLFKEYRKFLHFTVLQYFSYCDYKFLWLIKEKLLDNENKSLDPFYGEGLDLNKLSEIYFNDPLVRVCVGNLETSSESLVKGEILKKLERLEILDRITELEKTEERGNLKFVKFNLKWKSYPIRYSIGVAMTFILFHLSKVFVDYLAGVIIG